MVASRARRPLRRGGTLRTPHLDGLLQLGLSAKPAGGGCASTRHAGGGREPAAPGDDSLGAPAQEGRPGRREGPLPHDGARDGAARRPPPRPFSAPSLRRAAAPRSEARPGAPAGAERRPSSAPGPGRARAPRPRGGGPEEAPSPAGAEPRPSPGRPAPWTAPRRLSLGDPEGAERRPRSAPSQGRAKAVARPRSAPCPPAAPPACAACDSPGRGGADAALSGAHPGGCEWLVVGPRVAGARRGREWLEEYQVWREEYGTAVGSRAAGSADADGLPAPGDGLPPDGADESSQQAHAAGEATPPDEVDERAQQAAAGGSGQAGLSAEEGAVQAHRRLRTLLLAAKDVGFPLDMGPEEVSASASSAALQAALRASTCAARNCNAPAGDAEEPPYEWVGRRSDVAYNASSGQLVRLLTPRRAAAERQRLRQLQESASHRAAASCARAAGGGAAREGPPPAEDGQKKAPPRRGEVPPSTGGVWIDGLGVDLRRVRILRREAEDRATLLSQPPKKLAVTRRQLAIASLLKKSGAALDGPDLFRRQPSSAPPGEQAAF